MGQDGERKGNPSHKGKEMEYILDGADLLALRPPKTTRLGSVRRCQVCDFKWRV